MKVIKFLFLSIIVLSVIHCRDESADMAADLVLINGNIVTVDENNPQAKANARMAFGTDWPVESLNPMEGIYSAVSRKSISDKAGNAWLLDERLSVEEAVEYIHSVPLMPLLRRRSRDLFKSANWQKSSSFPRIYSQYLRKRS